MPELPLQRLERFVRDYQIPEYDAGILIQSRAMADYYEAVVKISGNAKSASNWIMVELLRELNDNKIEIEKSPVSSEALAKLIKLIDSGKISGKIAKTVFSEMFSNKKDPEAIIQEKGLAQVSDSSSIEKWVDEIIAANAGQVEQYRSRKDKVFGFFVGQVMRASKGQANPDLVNQVLLQKLKGS